MTIAKPAAAAAFVLNIASAVLLAAALPASAQTACKHNSPTSNWDCMPREPTPWNYKPTEYTSPVTPPPLSNLDAAVAFGIAHIPDGYTNFCSFNYQVNNPPWTTITTDPDFTTSEKRTWILTGTVSAGTNCATVTQQNLSASRSRSVFCPAGWYQNYDGLGSLLCYRPEQTTPFGQCSQGCRAPSSAMPGRAPTASQSGWVGDGLFAHLGDKAMVEVDYSSEGNQPLKLRRTYLSTAFPQLIRSGYRHFGLGAHWRTSYDRRLQPYVGGSVTSKMALRPDGSTLYFYQSGSNWNGRAEQAERLANRLDGSGNVIGWQLFTADNVIEDYDIQGRVIAISEFGGNYAIVAYGTNDLVSSVTDAFGRQLTFSYDANGNLQSVATPAGLVQFTIDDYGYLSRVTYPDGTHRDYAYMEPAFVASTARTGLLTGVIDENGNRLATYRYDSSGRAYQGDRGLGVGRYTIAWGANTTVTDPLGTARTYFRASVKGF